MTSENAVESQGSPLLDWLVKQHPETPKKRAKQWILAGRVSVHGEIIRQPHRKMPDPGEGLELLNRSATALSCGSGWQIHPRVAILYLDPALAVVNKGPGLISVPAPNADISALSILADFMSGKLKAQDRSIAGKSLPPAYRQLKVLPVHRLDQYTSGVFCMATNAKARGHLIEQLKAHTMRREYVAYVQGQPATPAGTWRHWLRLSEDELRQHVITEAEAKANPETALEAITHYEVATVYPLSGSKGVVTKLRLWLETGRKHQIRAQAAHSGVPLIGDRAYNPSYRSHADDFAPIDFDRQALHAETLTLEHPDKPGSIMTWTAELPKDMRQLEAALQQAARQSRKR
jgi:23S rRNA pseudouridine1911/1915/1917 synthase